MQIIHPKISLYRVRTLSDNFSATFDFVRENFKMWFVGNLYLLLPLCLIQGYAMNTFIGDVLGMSENSAAYSPFSASDGVLIRMGVSYIAILLFATIGDALTISLCYAMMKYYDEHDERLKGVTLTDLKPMIIAYLKKVAKATLAFLGIFVLLAAVVGLLIFALGEVSLFFIAIIFLASMVITVPIALFYPIYIFEEIKIIPALKRSLHLGFPHFFSILGFVIVISLLSNILQSFISAPWYIMYMLKVFFAVSNETGNFTTSALYSFGFYLTSVLMSLGIYLSASLTLMGLGYVYGSIAEESDAISVDKDIENFAEPSAEDKEIDNFDNLI